MKSHDPRRWTMRLVLTAAIITTSSVCRSPAVFAVVLTGESSSFGRASDLFLGPAPSLTIVDDPSTGAGLAPAPFVNNANLAGSNVTSDFNGFTIAEFITLEVDANASSNVDGGIGVRSASADATANDVEVRVFSQALPLNPVTFVTLFELNATSITATADVTGDFGALVPTGTTSISGTDGAANNQASITVTTELDSEVFLLNTAPAPGESFTILPGVGPGQVEGLEGTIQVIMNEQLLIGDGATDQSIEVTALRVIFNSGMLAFPPNFTQDAFFGEFVISNADARLTAALNPPPPEVPEPTSIAVWLLLAAILAGGGCCRNWRSN